MLKISPACVNQTLFKYFAKPEAAIDDLIAIGNKRRNYKKRDQKDADD